MNEKFDTKFSPAIVSVVASTIGETVTLAVCFPFELVKARLMAKNHIFQYKSIPQAFNQEITKGGFLSLYKGCLPYLTT